ncbi:MAG: hypothetical protein K6G15_11445 [Desulfovibrio sp.]|nr:hypothetical protein [Desulfovibrio sp.]
MEQFFSWLNSAAFGLMSTLGYTAQAHTRLYSDDLDGVLVLDDASLVSLLRLEGSLRLIGEAEFAELVAHLQTILAVPLGKSCHSLQVVFQYDPCSANKQVHREFQSLVRSAQRLHLDLNAVLDDWEAKIARYTAEEEVYLAFWTRPWALSKAQWKMERKKLGRQRIPAQADRQGKDCVIAALRDSHISQVKKLVDCFAQKQMLVHWLPSAQAVAQVRRLLCPDLTPPGWRPRLKGDHAWLEEAEAWKNPHDLSRLLLPTLARQIWPGDVKLLGRRYVRACGRIYAPFVLSLPPQTILPFNRLFQSLKGEMPWRASFLLTGNGLARSGLKKLASQVLAFAGQHNRMYSRAYQELEEAMLAGTCIVGFQACFCTWLREWQSARPLEDLARASAHLQSMVQSWGSCETLDDTGDALLALTATVPCLMPAQPAPRALAPLPEAIALLPFTRTASPWQRGDLPLRTPDGKYMPVGLFHSLQASWNEVVFAGMGAGKSFFLNTLNFFFLLRSGQNRLPWLTVIDIGPSCAGVVNLIRWALPKSERHLAVFAQLKNLASHAINPFDTPLGCPYPLRNHQEFLNNLLSLLCTPLDKTAPADGVSSLLREACDQLYKRLAPDGAEPRRFDPYLLPEVSRKLRELGFALDGQTTWWEVVDVLFAHGELVLAQSSQRQAMPLMADLAQAVTWHNVAENYQGILAGSGGESVPEACSRYLISALKEYPVLSHPTRFSLGSARVIGLDLSLVTPRGGPQAQRQSGIMYMLARFVGAGHFFTSLDDLLEVPERYRSYHRPRFESLLADPKRLCYDEFHRASCQDMQNPLSRQIISDLTTATRESRKRNLSIGLYSQRLLDFPKELVAMATAIYALGSGNFQEAKEIAQRFGYNHAAYEALRAIGRPSEAGADCIALYRTALGESILHLTNCAGGYARWAFSTTAEDMRLRNRLYDAVGLPRALACLARYYPQGSVKEEIERRKALLAEGRGDSLGGQVQSESWAWAKASPKNTPKVAGIFEPAASADLEEALFLELLAKV